MNFIKQYNGFFAFAEAKGLSPHEVAVYAALLHYNNKLNWINPFVCHHHFVCQFISISKNAYYTNMEKLVNRGLIKYKKGERNGSAPTVSIISLENKRGTIMIPDEEQNEEQKNEQRENLCKQLNFKTIKLLNNYPDLININLENWIRNSSSINKTESAIAISTSKSFTTKQNNKKPISEFKEQLLSDTKLITHNAEISKLDVKSVLNILISFIKQREATGLDYQEYSNVTEHFTNWMNKNKSVSSINTSAKSTGKILGFRRIHPNNNVL